MEANEIPAVDEVNDAVSRRIRTIPFLKHLFKYRSSLRQKEVRYFSLNLFFALDY